MEAILQFRDYHVLQTQYLFNPFFKDEDENEDDFSIVPEFEFSIDFPDEKKKIALITLGITIGDINLIDFPFFATATILGEFVIKSKRQLDEDYINNFYKVNAVAILFPYLRSLISDITGRGSEPPIIIPTMNIVELIKKYEERLARDN